MSFMYVSFDVIEIGFLRTSSSAKIRHFPRFQDFLTEIALLIKPSKGRIIRLRHAQSANVTASYKFEWSDQCWQGSGSEGCGLRIGIMNRCMTAARNPSGQVISSLQQLRKSLIHSTLAQRIEAPATLLCLPSHIDPTAPSFFLITSPEIQPWLVFLVTERIYRDIE